MTEEGQTLYLEAIAASEDLRNKLSSVRIRVSGSKSPKVVKAIESIFGTSYTTSSGDSYITYDMYCSIVNLIRSLGNTTAQETI